jgi:phosphoglycolate phosphatase (TIGR01487 family)
MAQSYQHINSKLASQIKLVMTDVDGTLTSGDGSFSSTVQGAVLSLESLGIAVGLISGRNLSRLESFAKQLNISGPIVAENGGVAKINKGGALIDLGYHQEPARKAIEKLRNLFPGTIEDGAWNKKRMVDLVIKISGIEAQELRKHLEDVELLNSGYVFHLLQKGISKGSTLLRVLKQQGEGQLSKAEVLVIGDSTTDLSLFELFPHSVLIQNPSLPSEDRELLHDAAQYVSENDCGEGFAEVALYITHIRECGK